jgi:hypothetical protein
MGRFHPSAPLSGHPILASFVLVTPVVRKAMTTYDTVNINTLDFQGLQIVFSNLFSNFCLYF